MKKKKHVSIIGSGNWGTTLAKIVATNVPNLANFEERVNMYVYDELVQGKLLSEIINEKHENVKYLPNIKLPENVVAVPDLEEAAKDGDFLVFVVPHQFIRTICSTLLGKIKPTAIAMSFIKGFDSKPSGKLELISRIISKQLRIQCAVVMGANLANEVAREMFCETTLACRDSRAAPILKSIFQTDYFKIITIFDETGVEVCAALKTIVACGAGFVDGLGLGHNTKAAVIRFGLMEMMKFVDTFYPSCKLSTFFESCGLADLTTTCYGGRNRRICEAFVRTGKSIKVLEDQMLNGQKLQGPLAAEEVHRMLVSKGLELRFPLFTTINYICTGKLKPEEILTCVKNNPEHVFIPKFISFQ